MTRSIMATCEHSFFLTQFLFVETRHIVSTAFETTVGERTKITSGADEQEIGDGP